MSITTYTELQSYFNDPARSVTLTQLRLKRGEMSDRYKRLGAALRASLGIT